MADIVLVEDEDVLRRYLSGTLEKLGHAVRAADSAEDGLRLIEEGEPDLLLTDHRLPGMSGFDLLKIVKDAHSHVVVVMMTAHGTIEEAVDAMREGAADYLTKPVNRRELEMVIERCLTSRDLRNEIDYYRSRDFKESAVDGIIGRSPVVDSMREMMTRLAGSEKKGGGGPTILLTGETGTGKGLVARTLHNAAPRGDSPFIEVNCAALPDHLLEAELMGYEKGAFTGATKAKPGLFEAAETGTMFLDEIGRMSVELQAKILKVIDDRRLRRLGSTRDRPLRCSIITATHLDMEKAVTEESFLPDLYHRINVFRIEVPALRERGEDIGMLAEHFLVQHAAEYGMQVPRLTDRAREALTAYRWPGNVRELAHAMERAVVLGRGDVIDVADITFFSLADGDVATGGASGGPIRSVDDLVVDFSGDPISLEELDRSLIRQAFEQAAGNRSKASKMLDISKDTLRYRLEKYGIE